MTGDKGASRAEPIDTAIVDGRILVEAAPSSFHASTCCLLLFLDGFLDCVRRVRHGVLQGLSLPLCPLVERHHHSLGQILFAVNMSKGSAMRLSRWLWWLARCSWAPFYARIMSNMRKPEVARSPSPCHHGTWVSNGETSYWKFPGPSTA